MQVTCSCGNRLFFAGDPDEEQLCDRCGQKVGASGPARQIKRLTQAVGRPPPQGVRGAIDDDEPPHRPQRPPRITTRAKLFIASEGKSRKGIGCIIILMVVAGGIFGADYHLHPPGILLCGHEGKASYLFGAVPFGHKCEALRALRYLEVARRAIAEAGQTPQSFEAVKQLPKVDEPPEDTPFKFAIVAGGSLVADPKERDSGLYHYLLEPDGTVRFEKDSVAVRDSPKSGSLAP